MVVFRCQKCGKNIVMICPVCCKETKELRRLSGSWTDPETGCEVHTGPIWTCPSCNEKLRELRGDK